MSRSGGQIPTQHQLKVESLTDSAQTHMAPGSAGPADRGRTACDPWDLLRAHNREPVVYAAQ